MNEPIEIVRVGNGYLVRPAYRDQCIASVEDTQVFQSFAELIAWLSEHFDYRVTHLVSDM